MNVLSLFDGISCGRVALDVAGIEVDTYFTSEIEKPAIAVSSRNYPSNVGLGDINGLTPEELRKLPKIDLILAGSPCQGFSRNGKGLNFQDPRSTLFFKFIKTLKWIKENNNPDVKFLLENVEMKKEWKDVIDLYTQETGMSINSGLVSAQKRPRIYWTNIQGVEEPEDRGILLADILDDEAPESLFVDDSLMKSKPVTFKYSTGETMTVEEFIRFEGDTAIVRNATRKGYLIAKDGDSINLAHPNSKTRRGRVGVQKSNTLDTQCNQGVFINGRVRRYTLSELEKLQGLPVGYTEGISDSARKKAIGNGWNIPTIAHILSYLKEDE